MGLWVLLKAHLLDQAVTAASKSPAIQSAAEKAVALQRNAGERAASMAMAVAHEVRKDVSSLFSKKEQKNSAEAASEPRSLEKGSAVPEIKRK
jgi:hypothetical protein